MAFDDSSFDRSREGKSEVAESLLERIVSAVSIASNRPVLELEPLGRSLDFDAIEALVTSSRSDSFRCSFHYEGYWVEIDGDGMVVIREEPMDRK